MIQTSRCCLEEACFGHTDDFNLELELIPPHTHRRNAAEVAIRNFKSHFLSVLAGTAPDFPKYLWDKLLPQTELTLNLLRASNTTPTVSAYAHLFGPFDYNKMPLAPMGCKVHVHEPSESRATWAFRSIDGWYLSTSPEHYRTHNCFIKSTTSERLSDAVKFMHKSITNPSISAADKLMLAMGNLHHAIKQINHSYSEDQLRDLQNLMETTTVNLPTAPTTSASPVPAPSSTTQPVSRVPNHGRPAVHHQTSTPAIRPRVGTQAEPSTTTPITVPSIF